MHIKLIKMNKWNIKGNFVKCISNYFVLGFHIDLLNRLIKILLYY